MIGYRRPRLMKLVSRRLFSFPLFLFLFHQHQPYLSRKHLFLFFFLHFTSPLYKRYKYRPRLQTGVRYPWGTLPNSIHTKPFLPSPKLITTQVTTHKRIIYPTTESVLVPIVPILSHLTPYNNQLEYEAHLPIYLLIRITIKLAWHPTPTLGTS